MLAFLVNTEAKLKQWTKKLAYEEDVQKVLNDYNVSQLIMDFEDYTLISVHHNGYFAG